MTSHSAAASSDSGGTVLNGLASGLLAALRENRTTEPAIVASFQALAARFGTPLYVYDREEIFERYASAVAAFRQRFARSRVLYALKANSNPAILTALLAAGAGAEVVSGGELTLARRCGAAASQILFTSSSKSPAEIDLALREQVWLNLDSAAELEQVASAARRCGQRARVSFRINPAVQPDTLPQINTGHAETKFGLPWADPSLQAAIVRAVQDPHLQLCGLHCHIGSQIREPAAFVQAAERILSLAHAVWQAHRVQLQFVDLGGGIGIPYADGETGMTPDELATAYAPLWQAAIAKLGYEPELWIEPGRYLVGPTGCLVTRVNTVKPTPRKTYVNVDAGFQTLARPAMYGAYHRVRIVGRSGPCETLEIAGNVCETGDILASARTLPRPDAGDLVAILDTGAYGYTMASSYNSRPLPAEVWLTGGCAELIRPALNLDELAAFRGSHPPFSQKHPDHR